MAKNIDNKKKVVYIVVGEQYDGTLFYWHKNNEFHWNIWSGMIYYKSKQGAIRNAKKAKAIYKHSIGKTYVLKGYEGMPEADFTPISNEEEKTND